MPENITIRPKGPGREPSTPERPVRGVQVGVQSPGSTDGPVVSSEQLQPAADERVRRNGRLRLDR